MKNNQSIENQLNLNNINNINNIKFNALNTLNIIFEKQKKINNNFFQSIQSIKSIEVPDFKFLIIGTGESSLAILNYFLDLAEKNIFKGEIYITDTRPENLEKLKNLESLKNINLNSKLNLINWQEMLDLLKKNHFDLLSLTAGLSPLHPAMQAIWSIFTTENLKTQITSELDIFYQIIEKTKEKLDKNSDIKLKTIAITGTNGKTTTTDLCTHIINNCGEKAIYCGNISPSLLQACLNYKLNDICFNINNINDENIENINKIIENLPQFWVLELSSFQLALAQKFKFDAAAILNISEDHFDWHGDFDDYINSKLKIFQAEQYNIAYAEDSFLKNINLKNLNNLNNENLKLNWFSKYAPNPEQDIFWGISDENDQFYLSYNYSYNDLNNINNYKTDLIIPANALRMHGMHNARNALAALALTYHVMNKNNLKNSENSKILENSEDLDLLKNLSAGLQNYHAQAHRVEFIGLSPQQALIYDDSKGTNVGASMAAIEGLGNQQKNIVLIAGGDGKGQDFSVLAPAFSHLKKLHLIGLDKLKIAAIAIQENTPYEIHETLEQATIAAVRDAGCGEIILLSPACASLDMFKNYVHRAKIFQETIEKILQIQ